MAKRKRRRPFETEEPKIQKPEKLIDTTSGIFGFMRDYGVRETVESIIVAVVLALMFRTYEAEAFIIPTGSMAPTLQGQHMDVVCEECGYQYRAGASQSSSTVPKQFRANVTKTHCPICRYGMPMQSRNPDHVSNNGDRILVNKFVYDFQDPERFDVIVFKNPNNGKQNYIKRLVGIPGDNLLIENGDIHNFAKDAEGNMVKQIVRKPPDKLQVMLQLVDDNHYIATQMRTAGWPLRWNQWSQPNTDWKNQESGGHPYYTIDGTDKDLKWLRYRHLAPRTLYDEFMTQRQGRPYEWESLENDELPLRVKNKKGEIGAGALIRDHYEYNDRIYKLKNLSSNTVAREHISAGLHWVGDLAAEYHIEVESDSGSLAFDLVEGGVHFVCEIDIATGEAKLNIVKGAGNVSFDTLDGSAPTAQTNIKGKGTHEVLFANVDDKIFLFVDNQYVEFSETSCYSRTNDIRPAPKYSKDDPGDAEPAGIAAANAKLRVNRLKIFRDIYYIAPTNIDQDGNVDIRNEIGLAENSLIKTYEKPLAWQSPNGRRIFGRPRTKAGLLPGKDWMFELADGQYFPMGDNSPASQDARIWGGDKFVDGEMLIGRAMFVYWPHSLNSPIKYFPNFKRMGFIR